MVPIGRPLEKVEALVVSPDLSDVPPGSEGELLLTGPQLSKGYVCDPERTALAFIVPPDRSELYYRTGDMVRRPFGDGPFIFRGRLDQQVKVFGMRVELEEIEAVLREETGSMEVAAIGWPETESGFAGIVAFLSDFQGDVNHLRDRLKERLPLQMVPRSTFVVDRLPRNANGKLDRQALAESMKNPHV